MVKKHSNKKIVIITMKIYSISSSINARDVEKPFLNPNWYVYKMSFCTRKLYMRLNINFSKTLSKILSNEIGL